MYCPECATQNVEGVRFCRSCGQELEGVTLALRGAMPKRVEEVDADSARYWLEKQGKGVSESTTGAILLLVSVLIGGALAMFLPGDVPWMLIWLVFVGWMAGWGGISIATGVGATLEARSRLRALALLGGAKTAHRVDTAPDLALGPRPVASVTEDTTRHLEERGER